MVCPATVQFTLQATGTATLPARVAPMHHLLVALIRCAACVHANASKIRVTASQTRRTHLLALLPPRST